MEMRSRRDSSVRNISRRVYKFFGFQFSELKTRLSELGAREESFSIVVYEKGVVKVITA